MRLVTLLSFVSVCVSATGTRSPSPEISASIVASWPAPSILVQYLECLSLESPLALIPFIDYLTHTSAFASPVPLTLPGGRNAIPQGINPLFTPYLLPNETYNLIELRLTKSVKLRRREERESLRLSVALREGSVVIEGMRRVWEDRELELVDQDGGDCANWVDIHGHKACTVDQFWAVVGDEQRTTALRVIRLPDPKNGTTPLRLHAFDHLSPPTVSDSLPHVVFYASPTDLSFTPLFSLLISLSAPSPPDQDASAPPPRLQFALRWKPTGRDTGRDKLTLSGYGAGLDIKKSDYLAIDDRLAGTGGSSPGVVLGHEGPKMIPVKKDDVAELGLRAASYILTSPHPLKAFTHLTSTFPLLASHLSTLIPTPHPLLQSELFQNSLRSPAASSSLFSINGLPIPPASVDAFALVRLMRKERRYITDLARSVPGLQMREAREILARATKVGEEATKGVGRDGRLSARGLGELFDAGDGREGGGVVLWWNDLEKDRRYASWSSNLRDLLRPTYPGQMTPLARNLNNLILVVDLARRDSLVLLGDTIRTYIARGIPVRFGMVPLLGLGDRLGEETTTGGMVAKVVWYLVETVGRAQAMQFLNDLAAATPGPNVIPSTLRALYAHLAQQTGTGTVAGVGAPLASLEDVIQGVGPNAVERVEKARAYVRRLGVGAGAGKESGAFFLNGAYFPLDDEFTNHLQRTLALHIQFTQQEIYLESLTDESNVATYFYDLPTTYARRNPHIFPGAEANPLRIVNLFEAVQLPVRGRFLTSYIDGVDAQLPDAEDEEEDAPSVVVATIFVIADLDSPDGRALARSALELLSKRPDARVAFLHYPSSLTVSPAPHQLSDLLHLLIKSDTLVDALPFELLTWFDLDFTREGAVGPANWADDNPLKVFAGGDVSELDKVEANEYWREVAEIARRFGFAPGEMGLLVNGRVIGPFEGDAFTTDDIEALLDYELVKRIMPVVEAIKSTSFNFTGLDGGEQARFIMTAGSIVSLAYLPDPSVGLFGASTLDRSLEHRELAGEHSSFTTGNEDNSVFEIAVVVDPVSELAQRWAPIIETLATLDSVHLRLYLNPSIQLTELPIKRFYTYTFPSALAFDPFGQEIQPSVSFEGIPEDVLLTFAMDLPRAWLAFPKSCGHDLDNIRLADLPASARVEGVRAVFELESLIVDGHARDMPSSQPPRGLQLELLSGNKTVDDTIVMANLGYFQLQANPGLWRLGIRAGKSSDVFAFESIGAEGWKSGEVEVTGDELEVNTLEGLTIYPRLRRNKGYETTELLGEDEQAGRGATGQPTGIVDRLKTMFPFIAPLLALAPRAASTGLATTTKRAEINVFTVASGLLYERMAFLMVVSVMRHTNSSVKFYFIHNFLSPSFKAFIPHMAKEYKFDYELVTYQWPHWLRAQKEKQRTIWGYKILFLDVLFPLELDRVIFVDSDQIVRTDLKELVDLDLNGAPYAYAPMGNDREETKGFRFWDSGYWKEHLRGAPYHISALYVVDLDRFRQIAAGDRLRQQYQGLSADPNSLSNLDQDLPNNMQASIPIYTLDPSWLWCETWCSDESLARAKTIDLCNNPLTHEPKLARAKRLIPEWTVYDDEVAAFAQRIMLDSASTASEDSVGAFGKKADELEQAVQQSVERDEFVEATSGEKNLEANLEAEEREPEERRVKDEL